jgi:fluoride exporter
MRNYIFIGVGGFLGAICRVLIKNIHIYHYKELIPLNTLIINVTGSFILALFLTIAFEIWEIDESIRLGITTGFLGGYTTFSTLCKEAVSLLTKGDYFSAITYITMSAILGLAGVYMGVVVAREVIAKIIKENKLKEINTDVLK